MFRRATQCKNVPETNLQKLRRTHRAGKCRLKGSHATPSRQAIPTRSKKQIGKCMRQNLSKQDRTDSDASMTLLACRLVGAARHTHESALVRALDSGHQSRVSVPPGLVSARVENRSVVTEIRSHACMHSPPNVALLMRQRSLGIWERPHRVGNNIGVERAIAEQKTRQERDRTLARRELLRCGTSGTGGPHTLKRSNRLSEYIYSYYNIPCHMVSLPSSRLVRVCSIQLKKKASGEIRVKVLCYARLANSHAASQMPMSARKFKSWLTRP